MTTFRRQGISSISSRNLFLDWIIPVLSLCPINIPNRKAAIS
jgi:hypothetical protein